jgi:heterodisulfide reductase subunit C
MLRAENSEDTPTSTEPHSSTSDRTLSGRLENAAGVHSADCYQCGKCTAGCPLAAEMDHAPSQLLRMLQTDLPQHEERALRSRAIWMCVGCQTCVSRCPKLVDLPRAMDFLRQESLARGLVNRDASEIVAFHRAFLDSIERHGRVYELGLVAGYKLRTGHLAQDTTLAPAMVLKGKLGLLPHAGNRAAVAKIFARARALQKGSGQ